MGTLPRTVEYDVRRRSRVRLGLGGLAAAIVLVTLAAAFDKGLGAGLSGIGAIAMFLVSAFALARLERYERGDMTIDDDAVRLGETVLPRSQVKNAYFAPGAGRLRSCVRLLGPGDRYLAQIAVDGPAAAEPILDALALGPSKRTARFDAFAAAWTPSWLAGVGTFAAGFLPMMLSIPFHAPWLFILTLLLFIGGSVIFLPADVFIGADGLFLRTRLAPRFFSWADVIAVEPHRRGVVVRTKKEKVFVPLTSKAWMHNEHEQVTQKALLARAGEALSAYRRGDQPDVAARIARAGRPAESWLRDLFDREGSFRQAPILDDQLWTVLESASADTTARAGAAAVLARTAEDLDRTRLRIAAEACTAPALRVVLDRAAAGVTEAELVEALLEVEDDKSGAAS